MKRILVGVLLVAGVAVGQAQGGADTPEASGIAATLPKLSMWELDNGLRVAFMPVKKAPVVTVQVWYHAGSKDEPADRRGSAHMFEHIMFKGSTRVRPEEHARLLNKLGGYVNAATSWDTTAYYNTLPKQYLNFACELEGERMRSLLFRDDMIATEQDVVKEEIRQRILNNPLSQGVRAFFATAFTSHPYSWDAGGYLEDLGATTSADLQKFYNTYYVPNNALLVVVGDVTQAQVEKCAADYFGSIPRGAEPARPADALQEAPQTEQRRKVMEPSQVGLVLGGYKVPAARHDDMYALQILALILQQGESSRLHRRLVRDDKIALQVLGQIIPLEHPGLFVVGAAYLRPEDGPKVEAALLDEVALLQRKPPSAKELTKAKNQFTAQVVFGLEGVGGLAQQIGQSWILTGNPADFLTAVGRYEQVTAADIQRVAKTYLNVDNMTLVVIPPAGAAGGAQ